MRLGIRQADQEDPPVEAAFLANLDMCVRYGLAFYYGEFFGELEEVYRP